MPMSEMNRFIYSPPNSSLREGSRTSISSISIRRSSPTSWRRYFELQVSAGELCTYSRRCAPSDAFCSQLLSDDGSIRTQMDGGGMRRWLRLSLDVTPTY